MGPEFLEIYQDGIDIALDLSFGVYAGNGFVEGNQFSVTLSEHTYGGTVGDMNGIIYDDSLAGKFRISEVTGTWYASRNIPRTGSTYSVWGGYEYLCDSLGFNPQNHGYVSLGKDSVTRTFSGSYPFYVIHSGAFNIAKVDAVMGDGGQEYYSYCDGYVLDYANIGGQPDGLPAAVGGIYEGFYGGYVSINASQDSLDTITIYVVSVYVKKPVYLQDHPPFHHL